MLIKIIEQLQDYMPTNERSTILRYINSAAKELYESADLPGSLFERDFCVNTEEQLITVPWYVRDIRGVRRKEFNTNQQIVDIRPRYNTTPWLMPFNQWRLIAETPLEQHITQAGRLVFTLLEAEETAVSVTVTGQTTTSSIYTETLTFAPGELTKTTVKQYTQEQPFGIRSLTKSRLTTYDILVTQEADARQLATIPNVLRRTSNSLIMLRDELQDNLLGDSECYEILFKWPFIELTQDSDEFLRTDRYDDIVAWKAKANYSALNIEDHPRMLLAEEKCNGLIRRITDTLEGTADKKLTGKAHYTQNAPLTHFYRGQYGIH